MASFNSVLFHVNEMNVQMKTKDILLIAGAVAMALKSASPNISSPIMAAALNMIAIGLAWWAQKPRDPNSHERVTDSIEVNESDLPE